MAPLLRSLGALVRKTVAAVASRHLSPLRRDRTNAKAGVLGVLLASLAAAPALAAEPAEIVGRAVDLYIRPTYEALHGRTQALQSVTGTLCDAPSAPHLAEARAAFSGAVAAWSRAEIIRFGPVTEANRLERILFWPDRKGIGLKQVQAALAARDPTATDPAKLAGKSVAMQGLGALEFLLHGTGADALAAGDAHRCAYAAAIAANLDGIAAALSAEWAAPDGFAAIWTAPGPQNPQYRDGDEALTELLEVFINGLELIRDVRLKGFLAGDPKGDRPRLAIYWRSGNTLASIDGNLSGMRDLMEKSGLGADRSGDDAYIAQSTRFEFANAIQAAETVAGSIEAALGDPQKREKLAYLALVTTSLSELFGTKLTAAYGLTAGFSSLDGD